MCRPINACHDEGIVENATAHKVWLLKIEELKREHRSWMLALNLTGAGGDERLETRTRTTSYSVGLNRGCPQKADGGLQAVLTIGVSLPVFLGTNEPNRSGASITEGFASTTGPIITTDVDEDRRTISETGSGVVQVVDETGGLEVRTDIPCHQVVEGLDKPSVHGPLVVEEHGDIALDRCCVGPNLTNAVGPVQSLCSKRNCGATILKKVVDLGDGHAFGVSAGGSSLFPSGTKPVAHQSSDVVEEQTLVVPITDVQTTTEIQDVFVSNLI